MSKEEYCDSPEVKSCLKEYTDRHRQQTQDTSDAEQTDANDREGLKKFIPKTELPKEDWRRKLDYKVPALLEHVWKYENRSENEKFLSRYKGQLGACLAQLDENDIERPVAYASATLSDTQQNYGITDKKGLAVAWAGKKRGHFVHGSSALVVIDHPCLRDLTANTTSGIKKKKKKK